MEQSRFRGRDRDVGDRAKEESRAGTDACLIRGFHKLFKDNPRCQLADNPFPFITMHVPDTLLLSYEFGMNSRNDQRPIPNPPNLNPRKRL